MRTAGESRGGQENLISKINQDSFLVKKVKCGKTEGQLFCVMDGHGPVGHKVSDIIKLNLVSDLQKLVAAEAADVNGVHCAFNNLFTSLDTKVSGILGERVSANSGSTCTVVLVLGGVLWTAWVGDSRAILLREVDGRLIAEPLSRDHKPDLPEECERVMRCGGVIDFVRS